MLLLLYNYTYTSQICSPFSLCFLFFFLFLFFPSHLYNFSWLEKNISCYFFIYSALIFFLLKIFDFIFFSLKKLASTTQYVIVLYTTIIISIATKLNFVFFVFSSQKKIWTDRPSLFLLILTLFHFILLRHTVHAQLQDWSSIFHRNILGGLIIEFWLGGLILERVLYLN